MGIQTTQTPINETHDADNRWLSDDGSRRTRMRAENVFISQAKPKDWVLRLGHRRAVLLVTFLGTLGSVLVSLLLVRLLGLGRGSYPYAAVIATVVPLIMIPLTISRLLRLTIQLEEARAQLHYLATHDSLTAAYNRTYFMTRFELERLKAEKSGDRLSIMMIDVDEFKAINDCYGHVGGDLALEAIARAIQSPLRKTDVLARYGGEEFIVLLPSTTLAEACEVAEKIRGTVAGSRIAIQDEELNVTVSIGISCADRGFAQVIDRADAALYEAKRNGRNRWAC